MSVTKRKDGRPYTRLGRAIVEARERARLSQPELAELAHVSRSYIGAIEVGTRRPSPEILRGLARVLEVDYQALAPLAKYSDPDPQGAVNVPVDAPKVASIRWFATLPADVLRRAERMARIAFIEETPAAEADADTGDMGDGNGEHDGANA